MVRCRTMSCPTPGDDTMDKTVKKKGLVACNLCGARDEHELSDRDRDGAHLRTVICRNCGLVYTNPRPAPEEIAHYYERSYRLDYKGVLEPKRKHVARAAKVAAKRVRDILEYLTHGMRSLDIGSGGGEMVYAMRMLGLDGSGLEPNEGYSAYARNILRLPVSSGCIENAVLPENYYDLLTMYHVIEHLHDPLGALQTLHSAMKPNGVLVVECPNVEAHCQAPSHRLHRAHLYNFNTVTLQALAEKAGFRLVRLSLSPGGGNINAILEKMPVPGVIIDHADNCQRVLKAWNGHTALRYCLSPAPYVKAAMNAFMIVKGMIGIFLEKDREALLEKTFEGLRHLPMPRRLQMTRIAGCSTPGQRMVR